MVTRYIFGERKLIQSNQACVLILPAHWIKHHKLKRRDSVDVEWDKESGALIIRPGGEDGSPA